MKSMPFGASDCDSTNCNGYSVAAIAACFVGDGLLGLVIVVAMDGRMSGYLSGKAGLSVCLSGEEQDGMGWDGRSVCLAQRRSGLRWAGPLFYISRPVLYLGLGTTTPYYCCYRYCGRFFLLVTCYLLLVASCFCRSAWR